MLKTKKILKYLCKLFFDIHFQRKLLWIYRIKNIPRYELKKIILLKHQITFTDSASFLFMYSEIFEQEIYKFHTENSNPFIIDAGANIGLSTIYFKSLYPNSNIIAFEPDFKIFKILEENVAAYSFKNVSLINKAVWNSETQLNFMEECADGGRVKEIDYKYNTYKVETVRLKDYLKDTVDFLKIDIEGAETEVIEDCQEFLYNVKNIFIEYHSFTNQPQTLDKIISILHNQNFRYYIHQMRYLNQPFVNSAPYLGMDMILNIFAWKVL